MTKNLTAEDLPAYLAKPLARSRSRGHVQTLMFVQLLHKRYPDSRIEIAVCENVTSYRKTSDGGSTWSRWKDRVHEDTAAAMGYAKRSQPGITWISISQHALLLPLNETDVRNVRASGKLPRFTLEYGSTTMSSLYTWLKSDADKPKLESTTEYTEHRVTMTPAATAPTSLGDSMRRLLATTVVDDDTETVEES